MPTQAVQHIRRMRGGAQSHLMRCADSNYYVVKFQNNPQHTRVLVNDWLGTRLAEMIGLPVPVADIVDVHPWLIEHSPELRIELCGRKIVVTPGPSFGSRYVVSPEEGQVHDYLPETMIGRVRNLPFRRHAGVRQVDLQCRRSPGSVLEAPRRTQIHRQLNRPGILLQCRGMELSGCSAAWRLWTK